MTFRTFLGDIKLTQLAARWALGVPLFTGTDSVEENNFLIMKLTDGNLRIDLDALRRAFCRPELKGKKIAIISIAGQMRTGKSLLMNFVRRYLRHRGWENNNWMGDPDFVEYDESAFRHGFNRVTVGVCILDEIFEVPVSENETMMVMLMETRGIFDRDTPESVTQWLLILTTLMSSIQILNSKDNINRHDMKYLKTSLDFASKTVHDGRYLRLQNLMFLVRDFCNNDEEEEYGKMLKIGMKYLQSVLDYTQHGEELAKVCSRIKQSFDRVECFTMPHPGLRACRRNFQGKNRDLEIDFLECVKEFVEHIVSPCHLLPKQSSTHRAVSALEIFNIIAASIPILAKKKFSTQAMIEANQSGHLTTLKEEAVENYYILMNMIIDEKDDLIALGEKHEQCRAEAIQRLMQAKFNGADDLKKQCLEEIQAACDRHFKQKKILREEKRRFKEARTSFAIMKYEERMRRCLSKPLTDAKLEELHKKHAADIRETFCDFVDFDYMRGLEVELFEKLKNENKHHREKEQRNIIDKASLRAASMWDEFLTTCRGEFAMKQKRNEIVQKILDELWKTAGPSIRPEQSELLKALDERYEEAKRQNHRKEELAVQEIARIRASRLDVQERIEQALKVSKHMWKKTLTTCRDDSAMEKEKEEIFEFISTTFLDQTKTGDSDEQKELTRTLNKCYEEAKSQNKMNREIEHQKQERTQEAIQTYMAMMKELPEPMTDAAFEEHHERHRNLVCRVYADRTDEETLKLRLTERYEILKLGNRQNSRSREIARCTRGFYEGHLRDDRIYTFSPYTCKGKVLIINNNFTGAREWERPGSEVDVQTMNAPWRDLGFHVYTKHNLTAEEMKTSCTEFAQNIGKPSSFVLTIMSHGDNLNNAEFIYGNDKRRVETKEIISSFTNCLDLTGVPKVFMFQACRGRQRDGDHVDAAPEAACIRPRTPTWADTLIVYPSQIGHVAYRNPRIGSPLINEVAKIFTQHAHNTDVLSMLTMVNNEVASTERQGGCVQMSNQLSHLRKKLFLFPGFPN